LISLRRSTAAFRELQQQLGRHYIAIEPARTRPVSTPAAKALRGDRSMQAAPTRPRPCSNLHLAAELDMTIL
jgi:hypothetical protein